MIVDGRRVALTGTEWFRSAPSLVPWFAGGLLLLAAAAAAAYARRDRMLQPAALASMVIAAAAWTAGWDGILLDGRPSTSAVVLAVVWPVVSAGLIAAVASVGSGNARMVSWAIVGAIAATFTVPELPAFTHGFVLSALGDTWARVAILVSFAGGTAVVILCVPAIAALFSDDPLRRRLLATGEAWSDPDRPI